MPGVIDSIIAGSAGGIGSTLVCHPLDTVRTRLQTASHFRGALDCFGQTVKNEGARALYKGMSVPLAFQAVYKAVMFTSYNTAQKMFQSPGKDGPLPLPTLFICGSIAGCTNSFVVTPVELIRNRLMTQYQPVKGGTTSVGTAAATAASSATAVVYRGPIHVARDIISTRGVAGMWRGLTPTLMRDAPGVGMWYVTYETARRVLTPSDGSKISTPRLLLSGALGGVGFWSVALPWDLVKSRMQADRSSPGTSKSLGTVVRSVLKEEGLSGFYRGWTVAFSRGIPGAAVTFFTYSSIIDLLSPSP